MNFPSQNQPNSFLTSDKNYLSVPNNRQARHSETVTRYLTASTSDNTRKAYRADLEHFLAWGGTVPANPEMIAEYIAAHAEELAVSTLTRRLAAISKTHSMQGHESPTKSDLVRDVMKGIKRSHGKPVHQKAPVLKADVVAMVVGLGAGLKDIRDKALLLIGFSGGFRRSEIVGLKCTDIEWKQEGIVLTLRRSKCDQEGRGRKVAVPYATGNTCPVKALRAWLDAVRIDQGPVFRAVDRHGNVSASHLSPEVVALVVKERATAVGMDASRFSGHSLRAGLVTSAANAGVDTWKIRRQTGHASEATLQKYIRSGEQFSANDLGSLL
ncbi:MAG: tyrosine-type recombinase/integrase [Alphaproteobacteria bacterium]|jgi:site-specific recombinase XerD|nr:tyrosine-type recombinase/integrase [Alphaproteobacteria bacterium]MBT4086769.1 tyrosine-type recombinase/integrase [Alphaproteobacteria bacterium]MBT4546535.1 tyrosine-type recombinase/integrase [Alphaproteobacteria bacterium]MBT7743724.1 tyrosine-type recombinase/integrase [Alphaproteobacteria bacterium]